MKYKVVVESNLKRLMESVQGSLDAGFECIGGVAVTLRDVNTNGRSNSDKEYLQAMIYKEKIND